MDKYKNLKKNQDKIESASNFTVIKLRKQVFSKLQIKEEAQELSENDFLLKVIENLPDKQLFENYLKQTGVVHL